ncbi:MAG TPA: chromate resistance protein ChrB domain-containing protein [Thermoanaerobaculia bacterium]|jgi:hypothetical protein|nr:chromate resistance protein ChrB domain-containing protein [Thermoanaerobaculia bacterium]
MRYKSNTADPERPSIEWLLFIHQLPADPAYLRVKVARRLKRLGALQLKSSVYVLPAGDEAAEDFRWLLREVVAGGGEVTLSRATFVDGIDDEEVKAMFQRERDAEYEEITTAARAAAPGAEELARLRRRLAEAAARDPFEAPGRAAAEHALQAMAGRLRPEGEAAPVPSTARPQGATWVTRRGMKVDRLASAWLIRRFIDPQARFRFVDPATHEHAPGELRFDMYEGEYGHEGERCTYETLLQRFALDDPGLQRLGEMVHDLDCKESRFAHPEGPGVAAIIAGIAAANADDEARLAVGLPLFEALYLELRRRA